MKSTAVPAPDAARNPTARIAWYQCNRESVPIFEVLPTGATGVGCSACVGGCCWTFDEDFCPSSYMVEDNIEWSIVLTLVTKIGQVFELLWHEDLWLCITVLPWLETTDCAVVTAGVGSYKV